jgi:hypothetical protein
MSPSALNSAGSIQFREESDQHALSMTNHEQSAQVAAVSLFAPSRAFAYRLPDSSCARIKAMIPLAVKSPAVVALLVAGLLVAFSLCPQNAGPASPESAQAAAQPRGVLTRQPLKPAIRGRKFRLQFSPDGKYLLLQSDSGFFLFSTQPLKPVLHVDADSLYPVRFARDSQSLSGVSLALRTARWKIPNGQMLSAGGLPEADGCISGDTSPDGELFVCRRVDLTVHVYDLNSRHELLGEELAFRFPQSVTVPMSLPPDNVGAGPFGLASARSLQIFANQGMYPDKFTFSPDGTLVGVLAAGENSLWNLLSKRKVPAPGVLNKYPGAAFCFLDATRVLITAAPQHAEIVSLASGKVVGKLNTDASAAALASNPRYLILADAGGAPTRLYDLAGDRVIAVPHNVAIDLQEDCFALLDPAGQLRLYQLGQEAPRASTLVPLEGSPPRFSVAASPNLDLLALGFAGETGLYRVATGERILNLEYSWQVSVPDSTGAYFAKPAEDRKTVEILRGDSESGSVRPEWGSESTLLRATPLVFVEYQLQGPKQHVPEVLPDGKIPFELTAREPATGDQVWTKKFISSHPVPFVDPQGRNLVLGWEAATEGARVAAKRCPQAWPAFQKTKTTRNDTFFEVLDLSTGETRGGVLVRTGSGPLSFDSVAAVGSRLIIAKAEGRVTLYSLDDGALQAHLSGTMPAASEKSRLLALVEGDTRLGIYDLQNGQKLDGRSFGQAISYAHFSGDGRRLLVLTRPQTVYVLDVSDVVDSRKKE